MSLSISLHPLSKTLHLHGSPDTTCAYSLSGSVNVTVIPPTVDARPNDHSSRRSSFTELDVRGDEDDEVYRPLLGRTRSRWEGAHSSRMRTSDVSASSSSSNSRSGSTPILANPSSYSTSAPIPAPSAFNPSPKIDYPICSTSSGRSLTSSHSLNSLDAFDSHGSSAAVAPKPTAISNIGAIDSESGLFYNISNNCSTSHDSTPVDVSKETKILLTSLVVTFEGKAEHLRDGKAINSVRLCRVSQELIEEPVEISHQHVYVNNDVRGDGEDREGGGRAGNEAIEAGNGTTYGMIFDLLTIPGWIPATLRATGSNTDTNATYRSQINKSAQESTSLTSYSLFATATYQILYPETESTWRDTFDTFGFGGIRKLFQACVPVSISAPLSGTSSEHNSNHTAVEADRVEIEVTRCIATPPRTSLHHTFTSKPNDKFKSLYPPTVYRISSHTQEGESPIPNDVISKFEVVAAAPRFVGIEESRVPVTLKLRCNLGNGELNLADSESGSINSSRPFSISSIEDQKLAIEKIEIDLDQEEDYSSEPHEEYLSLSPLPIQQPPSIPLLHSTGPSTPTGDEVELDMASRRNGDDQSSTPWGSIFCSWMTGIERWVDRSVQAQNWACINAGNNGLCAELGVCVCEQQREREASKGMDLLGSGEWTKTRNILHPEAPSCFLLDPNMQEGTTRDLSKEEEEERTKDRKIHVLGDSWSVINFDAVLANHNTTLPTCVSPFVNVSHTLMVSIHVVYDNDKRDIVRFSLPIHFVALPPIATPTTSIACGQEPCALAPQLSTSNIPPSFYLPAYNQMFDEDGEVKADSSKGTLPLYTVLDVDSNPGSGSEQEAAGDRPEGGRKVMRPDLVPVGTEWIDWEEAKRAGWL